MAHTTMEHVNHAWRGRHTSLLSLNLQSLETSLVQATVIVDKKLVNAMYQHAIKRQQAEMRTFGFSRGNTPITYLETTLKNNVLEHLREFFFHHCVQSFLFNELQRRKIVITGEPLLHDIVIDHADDAQFVFRINVIPFALDSSWKKISFKSPSRKNYKDIDRQVETFIKEEHDRAILDKNDGIGIGDWVLFSMQLLNEDNKPVLEDHADSLWLRISSEDADRHIHELFLGKKVGESFISNNPFLQTSLSSCLDTTYYFHVTILEQIPLEKFSFELFNHHFNIHNNQQLHTKLIEIFSFRNDVSQRRETAEAAIKQLIATYTITLPKQLVSEQEKLVLEKVFLNPDYYVYKSQKDFKTKVQRLAEKQLKESMIIDAISHQENVVATHQDVVGYLNLLKRPRTKEFIYFELPSTKYTGHELPIPASLVIRICTLEKTLNYILSTLTKK